MRNPSMCSETKEEKRRNGGGGNKNKGKVVYQNSWRGGAAFQVSRRQRTKADKSGTGHAHVKSNKC